MLSARSTTKDDVREGKATREQQKNGNADDDNKDSDDENSDNEKMVISLTSRANIQYCDKEKVESFDNIPRSSRVPCVAISPSYLS